MKITLHPVLFAPDPQIELVGGPHFKNTYLEDAQGNPQTQIYRDYAQWEWMVQYVGERPLMEQLMGFFLARKGGGFAWLLQDPFDHSARGQNYNSLLDGPFDTGATGFVQTLPDGKRYLVKRYPDTFSPYKRRIRCPVPGSVIFEGVGGTPIADPYTGEVTGATSDGTARFEFYCPVIFAEDSMKMRRQPGDAGSSWEAEVREISSFTVASP